MQHVLIKQTTLAYSKAKVRKPPVKIRVRVGPSRIAGQGLFAEQDIKKGTRILPYIGEKIAKDESTRRLAYGNNYIFELNDRYDIDGKTLANTARYINHSCGRTVTLSTPHGRSGL